MGDISVGDGGMRFEPHDQTSGQGSATNGDHVRAHRNHSSDHAKPPGQYNVCINIV